MPSTTQMIEVGTDDIFYVSVSAHVQSFHYEIHLHRPDGDGGLQDGVNIGRGDGQHRQRIGSGAELHGAGVEVCVAHLGNTETSQYEIVARLTVQRGSQMLEDVKTWRIHPGLPTGDYSCIMLRFK